MAEYHEQYNTKVASPDRRAPMIKESEVEKNVAQNVATHRSHSTGRVFSSPSKFDSNTTKFDKNL
jgi:hypothetical protein